MGVSETIQSDIGKVTSTVIFKSFPYLKLEDVEERLKFWLNLDGIEDLRGIENSKYLVGRSRFSAMIPVHLAGTSDTVRDSTTKAQLFQNAIDLNIKTIRQKLTERVKSSLKTTKDDRFIDTIARFYFGARLGNGCLRCTVHEDLVNDGLASVEIRGNSAVTEPLAMEVLIEAYESVKKKSFEKNIDGVSQRRRQ